MITDNSINNPIVTDTQSVRLQSSVSEQIKNGLYTKENTGMVVSRGLAKESIKIPRFYNCPEIVMIELK